MLKCVVVLGLLAGFLVAAGEPNDTVKRTTERLQGTWIGQSALRDGEKTNDFKPGNKWTITGGTFSQGTKNFSGGWFTFTIDPTQKPAAMDVTLLLGPEKGQVLKAIYSLDDDTLKICIAVSAKARPTKFSGDKGTGTSLIVLKREKP